jgi:hypothetical protein
MSAAQLLYWALEITVPLERNPRCQQPSCRIQVNGKELGQQLISAALVSI